ncbi:MAG: hypothetical protein ACE5G0_07085 [Rhodothermales bacterium]
MLEFERLVFVLDRDAHEFIRPEPLDLTFEGFASEAFAILERLRHQPHIEQYRKEKEVIDQYLIAPFKRYRDDLVVNWVLPNRLDFETEKNVFSRLLKNDFGAGGCHHHLWMSFYRPGWRRLTDVQLSHSITPDGFEVGLFVGGYAKDLIKNARTSIQASPTEFLSLLLSLGHGTFYFAYGSGKGRVRRKIDLPLASLPDNLGKSDAIWIRRSFGRADVVAWKSELVRQALETLRVLWPIYQFVLR